MTSFPRLGSRHCTKDWLNPPPEMRDLLRRVSADLYHQGVDAHCGISTEAVSPINEAPRRLTQCNYALFRDSPFSGDEPGSSGRQQTEAEPPSLVDKRMGSLIGSSTHRRRSSQIPDSQNLMKDFKDTVLPSLMDKILNGGHKMIHQKHDEHHARKHAAHNGMLTPNNSQADDPKSPGKPRSRDSLVREHTPEPQTVDRAGIYEAMTGSRLAVPKRRRDTCSEDNRPHTCEFEIDSASGYSGSPA
jgi:hypothetical protein